MRSSPILACALGALAVLAPVADALAQGTPRVLVFTRTTGFRHDSIPAGIEMFRRLGANGGGSGGGGAPCFEIEHTEDPGAFTLMNLARFDAVVFLLTTGDPVSTAAQQDAIEQFVRAGGGWVGVHSAADTEYNWPFYSEPAQIDVEDAAHVSTRHLPARWGRTDEWYNFQRSPRPTARVLLRLDETTYNGGQMGADHPIAWLRDTGLGAGRSWYTGGGHTIASYSEPLFVRHVLGGVLWAMGLENSPCACRADTDGDGELTFDDVQGFVAWYNASDPRADFNADGEWTFDDIQLFVGAYNGGC